MGDMLCVVPLLRGIRQRYPDAFIAVMSSPVNHDVMVNNPYVDQVIRYDKSEFLGRAWIRWGRVVAFLKFLRREGFELAVVPSTVSTSVTSDLLAYCSGASYRIGAGWIDGVVNPSGVFHNSPVSLQWGELSHRHQTLRNLDIAHDLWLNVTDLSSEISLTEGEKEEATVFAAANHLVPGAFVSFHPGAGKPSNRWDAEKFAAVAERLHGELRTAIAITRGPMDDVPVSEMQSRLAIPYQLIENKSIRQVAAILFLARLVITNDTGIMHVAAAVGTPVLSLFGPTDPEQWAPIGTDHRYIVGKDGDVNTISVDEVVKVAREMLR